MARAVVRRANDAASAASPWPGVHSWASAGRRFITGQQSAFWIAQIGGWGAYGLSTYLTLLASLPASERSAFLVAKLLRAAAGFGASLLLRELYQALRRWRASPPVIAGGALIACTTLGAVWLVVYRLGIAPSLLTTPPAWGWDIFPRAALDLAFVLATWSGIYFGVLQWQARQDQSRRVLEAERLAQEARFHVLSAQLNPHFLFNALNSIRSLIGEDRERARDMVSELADFLRYSLAHDPLERVTVAQEIGAARDYLAIEGIRFEHRLRADTTLDSDAEACAMPGFLVLPLVENAVKHGERGTDGVLHVSVSARIENDRLIIAVRNSGRLRSPNVARGTGLGLRTVRGRLAHLHPTDHRFEVVEHDGWVTAVVDLPATYERGGPSEADA
jgi:signal transduction histidine kinase